MESENRIKKPLNAQHLSQTNDHFSPPAIVDLSRQVLGKIDLDPFSNAKANEYIQAKRYFGLDNGKDGWKEDWKSDTIFINPPGNKINGKSGQKLAWQKLVSEYEIGNVKSASIYLL